MENLTVESPDTISSSSANTLSPRLTYEDFLREYDGQHAEFVDGTAVIYMSVSKKHNQLTKFLIRILESFAEMKEIGEIFSEPYQMKMIFDGEIKGREPDIFFVKKEHSDKLKNNYLDGAADLVIEIISPESRVRDRGDKFYEYESAGVKEYWLIDYERKQAEFYVLNADGIYNFTQAENGIFESRVLNGLFIKPDWLWQENLPNLMDILKEWKLI